MAFKQVTLSSLNRMLKEQRHRQRSITALQIQEGFAQERICNYLVPLIVEILNAQSGGKLPFRFPAGWMRKELRSRGVNCSYQATVDAINDLRGQGRGGGGARSYATDRFVAALLGAVQYRKNGQYEYVYRLKMTADIQFPKQKK
jgi:hypothetical protein